MLTGLSVLFATSCASSRQASEVSDITEKRVLSQESERLRTESSEFARDTLIEVTTVTVQLNDVGDTVRTSTVTDRTRARSLEKRRDVEAKTEIVRDTVYIEKHDSVMVQKTNLENPTNKASPVVSALRWIFWIIVGLIAYKLTAYVAGRRAS